MERVARELGWKKANYKFTSSKEYFRSFFSAGSSLGYFYRCCYCCFGWSSTVDPETFIKSVIDKMMSPPWMLVASCTVDHDATVRERSQQP